MVVSVGDRESDLVELFERVRKTQEGAELLVRASVERVLTDDPKLWDFVVKLPEQGKQEVHVPRKGARAARTATLSVRFSEITLHPPKRVKQNKPLTLWVVYAVETNPPENGTDLLEWLLLTTVKTLTFDEALTHLHWYTKRWRIEVFHRTLKSGCKVENRQLGTAERIQSCLAIDRVVAWRVYYLTALGQNVPEVSCCVLFF